MVRNMNIYLRNKASMTLIEMLLCTALFSLIIGACTALLLAGWNSWAISSAQARLSQELSQSVSRMTNEIMQSGASVITNVPADNQWYPQITFSVAQASNGSVVWGPLINYSLGGIDGKQLMRTLNGQAQTVAEDITLLQFSRQTPTPNIVNVQLTASVATNRGSQKLTSTLNFKVFLHNT